MLYFIFTILFIILTSALYFLYKKYIKMKKEYYSKVTKFDDDEIMKDLRSLQKQLLVVDDPEKRIEIIKKIEIISQLYN